MVVECAVQQVSPKSPLGWDLATMKAITYDLYHIHTYQSLQWSLMSYGWGHCHSVSPLIYWCFSFNMSPLCTWYVQHNVANLIIAELPHSWSSQSQQAWGRCTSTLRCFPVGWPDQLPVPGRTRGCPQWASAAHTRGEKLLRREGDKNSVSKWKPQKQKWCKREGDMCVHPFSHYPTLVKFLPIVIFTPQGK